MPYHFVLVRHGESEANKVREAASKGDASYTTDFMERADSHHRLTPKGVEQSEVAGKWIQKHILDAFDLSTFDRSYCSPFVRAAETAAHLQLPLKQGWRLEYMVRERDFGDIEGITKEQFEQIYPQSAQKRIIDPLFWKPPGGESIAELAETRVREMYHTFHREVAEGSVIVVSHGLFLLANKLALEQPTPLDWGQWATSEAQKMHNCQILHYTRINPKTGEVSPYVRWARSICPWQVAEDEAGEWYEFTRKKYTNDELLSYAQKVSHLLA